MTNLADLSFDHCPLHPYTGHQPLQGGVM